MTTRPLELYHERTRRRGVYTPVYWLARMIVKPAILIYFRLRRLGREHIPEGRSDPRGQPPQLPRSVRDRLLHRPPDLLRGQAGAVQEPALGWFLNCLGAFPVRRGSRTRSR